MTMRIKALATACALGALLLSGPVAPPAAAGDVTGLLITAAERQIFEAYYGGQPLEASGGGGKKAKGKGKGNKALPQGIAMKLQRGGTLPPGIAKRDLPRDLLGQLPSRPHGQDYAIVDNDVVLIEAATGLILDILEDMARH